MEREAKRVAMPTDLKTKNRKRIMEAFRDTGGRQVTLNEISDITGISRQTIMKSMGYFLDLGIVQSLGKGASSEVGGKRPELYQFHAGYRYVLCIRIGHKSLMVAITNLCMEVVDQVYMEHPKNESLDVILENFTALYNTLMERIGISQDSIIGAGVCVSGICDQKTGIMRYNSVYPSWGRDIPIVAKFKERLPKHFLVYIINETKLTAMGEMYFEPEMNHKKVFVILTHGGGISGAYAYRGKVGDGVHALAGEIGHMTVDPNSEEVCDCGLRGCLERVVSEEVLLRKLRAGVQNYPDSVLQQFLQKEQYSMGEVVSTMSQAADLGDKLALEVTDYLAKFMSIGIKNIFVHLDPECIVFQGCHANLGAAYSERLNFYLSQFKYFPSYMSSIIFYDKREVNALAIAGIGYMLLQKYFEKDELYSE